MREKMKISLIIVPLVLLLAAGCNNGTKSTFPERKDITDAVFASGNTFRADEFYVAANKEGYLIKSFVKEGDSVVVGEPLFQLSHDVQSAQLDNAEAQYKYALENAGPNSPQVISLKTQIAQAKKQAELDKKNYERYSVLIKTNAVSQFDFENAKLKSEASKNNVEVLEKSLADLKNSFNLNLKNAQNQLTIQQNYFDDYSIVSDAEGKILNIYKNQGDHVNPGEYLAKIGSGKMIIKLFIAEEDIGKMKLGQSVVVSLNTNKSKTLKAVITRIYPEFDDAEQSFILEAEFTNKTQTIRANTQLQANIVVNHIDNALVIPIEFLNGDNTVTLSNNKNVPVKTGIITGKWVQILDGISESDKIIVK